MTETKQCAKCKQTIPISDFSRDKYLPNGIRNVCKKCFAKYALDRKHATGKTIPYTDLKTCSSYLGVHVAERLLNNVFRNVNKMPLNNHGYDFVCGKGYKVDSKCSTIKQFHGHCTRWQFDIERNIVADYFACIAFDNRDSLNPLYFWLIPSHKVNHLRCLTIGISTIEKWDIYRQPIDKLLECCNVMKGV